jgi:PAS domain-containing protein
LRKHESQKVKPIEPLELFQSWPLSEGRRRFDLGRVLDCPPGGIGGPADEQHLTALGVGRWECDLSDNVLTWSAGVYDIFGLARGAPLSRNRMVGLYCEESRAMMERLRAHAIAHKRGFTMDAQISPANGPRRWMRLVAAPICEGDRVARLHGYKLII